MKKVAPLRNMYSLSSSRTFGIRGVTSQLDGLCWLLGKNTLDPPGHIKILIVFSKIISESVANSADVHVKWVFKGSKSPGMPVSIPSVVGVSASDLARRGPTKRDSAAKLPTWPLLFLNTVQSQEIGTDV